MIDNPIRKLCARLSGRSKEFTPDSIASRFESLFVVLVCSLFVVVIFHSECFKYLYVLFILLFSMNRHRHRIFI